MFSVSGFSSELAYTSLLCLALIVSIHAAIRYTWLVGAFFGWTAYSALRIFAVPTSPYAAELPIWNASLSLASASALAILWIYLSVAPHLKLTFWKWIAATNVVLLVLSQGLLGNNSMSGCLSACLIPYAPWIGTFGALEARQSQPIALLFVVIGVRLIRRKGFKEIFAAFFASLIVGSALSRHALFDPNGRIEVWSKAWHFFTAHASLWLGTGLGTFYYIGPFLTVGKNHAGFVTLHSDWFQTAFEEGIVGFGLAALVYVQALIRSRRNEALFTSLVCFGFFGVANFPLHTPISSLFGAWLMHRALVKAPKETSILRQHYQE